MEVSSDGEREGDVNGYNFTDRVRKVLQMAREEAARLRHEHVATEHLLLGLIQEGEGVAATVLANLANVDLKGLRKKVEETVEKGKSATATGPDLPYTSRAKKVLELSMSEARRLDHSYVGTEHLLLGLLGERQGVAARVLTGAGVTLERARAEVARLRGSERPAGRGGRSTMRQHASFVASPLAWPLFFLREFAAILFTSGGGRAFLQAEDVPTRLVGLLAAGGGLLLLVGLRRREAAILLGLVVLVAAIANAFGAWSAIGVERLLVQLFLLIPSLVAGAMTDGYSLDAWLERSRPDPG